MSLDFAPAVGKTEHDIVSALRLPFFMDSTGTIESDPEDSERTEAAPSDPLDAIATRIGDDVAVNDAVTMNIQSVRAKTVKPLMEPTSAEEGATQLEFVEHSQPAPEFLPISTALLDSEENKTLPFVSEPTRDEPTRQDPVDVEQRYTAKQMATISLLAMVVGFLLGLVVSRFVG